MPFSPGPPIEEGPGPAGGGLGERIVNGGVNLGARLFNAIREPVGRGVDNTVKRWVHEAEDTVNGQLDGLVTKMRNAATAESPEAALRAMLDPLPLLAAIAGAVGLVTGGLGRVAGQWLVTQLKRPLLLLEY